MYHIHQILKFLPMFLHNLEHSHLNCLHHMYHIHPWLQVHLVYLHSLRMMSCHHPKRHIHLECNHLKNLNRMYHNYLLDLNHLLFHCNHNWNHLDFPNNQCNYNYILDINYYIQNQYKHFLNHKANLPHFQPLEVNKTHQATHLSHIYFQEYSLIQYNLKIGNKDNLNQ